LEALPLVGYTLIANTGLFAEACREWRKIRDIDKNMKNIQELFTEAEQDRSSLLTTSSQAGYHAGNVTAVIPTTPFAAAVAVPPPTEHALAMARVQATADATQTQMATLMAAMKSQTRNRKNNNNTS
jgi:F420-0:gamma-glutamyl ligase-like protein